MRMRFCHQRLISANDSNLWGIQDDEECFTRCAFEPQASVFCFWTDATELALLLRATTAGS